MARLGTDEQSARAAATAAKNTRYVCSACRNPDRRVRHRAGCPALEARRDRVVDMYVRLRLSERQIAKRLEVSEGAVHLDLVARGVPCRRRTETAEERREARRDVVIDMYVRLGLSERQIATRLGVSSPTIHLDLVAREVPRRPQTRGLTIGFGSPEQYANFQEGRRRYRAEVERVKTERGLIDMHELLARMRRAGAPRSQAEVCLLVRSGLLEPERGLGFAKPWLFAADTAEELITQLLTHPSGHVQMFNAATADQARSRSAWYLARHKSNAEFGRVATNIKRSGPKPKLASEEEAEIRRRRERGETQQQIADAVGVTRKQVRRVLAGGD